MLGDMHTTMIRFCHAGLGIRSSPRGKPLPWFLHIWMWMKNCSGWQHDLPSLKLTVRPWKGNDHLPTIHFQVRLLLVSGRVYLHVLNSRMLSNIFLQNMYEKCHVFFFRLAMRSFWTISLGSWVVAETLENLKAYGKMGSRINMNIRT